MMTMMRNKRLREPNLFSQARHPLPTNLAPPTTWVNKREMHTTQHQQSGLPDTSYAETSFMGEDTPLIETDSERKNVLDRLKAVFPKFSTEKFAALKGTTGKKQG